MKLFTDKIPDNVLYDFNNIKRILLESLETVKDYRSLYPGYMSNNNPLIKLVTHLPFDNSVGLSDYMYDTSIDDLLTRYGKIVGFNTIYSVGDVIENVLFGGIPELPSIITTDSDPATINRLVKNWETVAPIKFKWHSGTSLEFPVLDGKDYNPNSGFSVWEIDTTLLKLKYYLWSSLKTEDDNRSMAEFVTTELLPYTYDSFLDIVLINRFMRPYDRDKDKDFPIPLADVESRFKRVVEKSLARIDRLKQTKKYLDVLSYIPTVSAKNVSFVFRDVTQPPSVPVIWKNLISKIVIIDYLMSQTDTDYDSVNTAYINEVRIQIRRVQDHYDVRKILKKVVFNELSVKFNNLVVKLGA